MEDAFPDRNSLVLHLLSLSMTGKSVERSYIRQYNFFVLGDSLATIMNEALNPDTEFLLPKSPHLLTPIPQSTIPNTNSPTANAKTSDVEDLTTNYNQLKWDDQAAVNDSKVPTVLPDVPNDQNSKANNPADDPADNFSTETENNPTDELEVVIASDYETASESPSPSTSQDLENMEINPDDEGSNADASAREESTVDVSSLIVTEGRYKFDEFQNYHCLFR